MALEYLCEYRTYFHISQSYGVRESTAYKTVKWILNKTSRFCITRKKRTSKSDIEYEVLVIDVTETPVERPKKKQKRYYSGKKKKHTLKTQLITEKESNLHLFFEWQKARFQSFQGIKN